MILGLKHDIMGWLSQVKLALLNFFLVSPILNEIRFRLVFSLLLTWWPSCLFSSPSIDTLLLTYLISAIWPSKLQCLSESPCPAHLNQACLAEFSLSWHHNLLGSIIVWLTGAVVIGTIRGALWSLMAKPSS